MTSDKRLAEVDLANPTYLLVSGKNEPPNVVPLKNGASVFVGAGANCKVQLHDDSVQQLHCMFCLEDDNVLKVQDWNTGATYLNGELITEEALMQSGDIINVGCYCFTAVLDVEFHNGVGVELLSEDLLSNKSDELPELDLLTQTDQVLNELAELEKVEQASAVSHLNNEEFASDLVVERRQPSEVDFKYDLDAKFQAEPAAKSKSIDSLQAGPESAIGSGSEIKNEDLTSQLLIEVEQLRFELADRDSQILALRDERDAAIKMPTIDVKENDKLVSQPEDSSAELQKCDGQSQGLQELLRLSEEAVAADRDERAQMEMWITEIEKRVVQRQSESQAKVDGLVRQLKVAREDAVVLQSQLHSVMTGGVDGNKQNAAVTALNSQVEELRVNLQHSNEKIRELHECPADVDIREELRKAQEELANLRLKASRERADTARRHVELKSMQIELERSLSVSPDESNDGDSRIRAMRDHLREIQAKEQAAKAEQKANGLGGRITGLLSRLR